MVSARSVPVCHRGEVGPFDRVHVPAQHRALPLGGLPCRPLPAVGGEVLAQRHPGPLQGAVGRGDAAVEQRRGLPGGPAEHVAQDQHRPLPGRQALDRGEEGQFDGLPGHRRGLRLRLGLLVQAVRERLQPGEAGVDGPCLVRPRRPLHLVREHPPRPSVQGVQAGVRGYPVQPGAQRGLPFEAVEVLPTAQERLLHQILSLLERAQHPVAVHPQLRPVPPGQPRERLPVTRPRRGQAFLVALRAQDALRPLSLRTLRHGNDRTLETRHGRGVTRCSRCRRVTSSGSDEARRHTVCSMKRIGGAAVRRGGL